MNAAMFQELFLDPLHESRSVGIRLGSFVFLPFLSPEAKKSHTVENRTHAQIAEVLTLMDRALERAGTSRSDVARVTFFMRDVYERPVLNDVWERWFPDPMSRPPHKYVPVQHAEGVNVAIQVLAMIDGNREVLEIPEVKHVDPMSMGARTSNLVTSSRLFGTLSNLDDEISLVLERVDALMKSAGGNPSEITQATFFVGTPEIGAELVRRWNAHWAGHGDVPRVHMAVVDLGGGNGFPRIEIVGLIGKQAAGHIEGAP